MVDPLLKQDRNVLSWQVQMAIHIPIHFAMDATDMVILTEYAHYEMITTDHQLNQQGPVDAVRHNHIHKWFSV